MIAVNEKVKYLLSQITESEDEKSSVEGLLNWVVVYIIRRLPKELTEKQVDEYFEKITPELKTMILMFIGALKLSIDDLKNEEGNEGN